MKSKFLLILISFLLFSCNPKLPVETEEEAQVEQEEKPEKYSLTLIATGDNLFHITLINNALEKGEYNFSPVYSQIESLIKNADLSFINQETVMAGERYGYSGFPQFNTPQSLAKTLTDTGFDIFNVATNHSMDMGRNGLIATLDLLDTMEDITVIGARKSGENHRIIEKNNITFGFLSYTYGLNGYALPADNPNLVSLINTDKMTREINALRPLCDFLVVSMHWGEEYQLIEPNSYQKRLAVFLAEQNVDLIIGHHPHVLQRVETLLRSDGGKTLCFYSLGNFVSNQREKERILGGIMLAVFTKEGNELSITKSGLIPVICHFEPGYRNTKVYPIYNYTEELLKKHLIRQWDIETNFNFFHSVLRKLETKIIMYNPFPESTE
jgi:poly-gamma-glutamate synthesis protein (capsule biosynthesis protein)